MDGLSREIDRYLCDITQTNPERLPHHLLARVGKEVQYDLGVQAQHARYPWEERIEHSPNQEGNEHAEDAFSIERRDISPYR